MDFLIFQAPILMVQASMDGILLGILFALIAYGMALQWGVMNIINIAHEQCLLYSLLPTAEPFHKQLMQIKYQVVFHPLKLGPLVLGLGKLRNP